ncbi:1-deoxy-D-xylulose-5-phosphate synthase [Nocardiopsis kunsanensis]|uniref:1-deoxy-D-xylulose-5-phosphate synthase n=1 Tax=Nocardiopsis kunsanensis TaxID=141693 RepID=A0A918X9D5_9ACTN|nr:1-deoxy-D-xylulose-5-phosphate synthase [Nocardiopsis kunsanensis]GHD17694.1 1-deoxy-D-xylulose-5-phosphate synthase [Nocardiopsis kunsanensis]
MSLLEQVDAPTRLRGMTVSELEELAEEIRQFLIDKITRTGGHLGPNLGVVELTLALHTVFDSPRDRLLWDTGHQSYVHKMLTGRQGGFDGMRKPGGLSGYPARAESEHDLVENSHASTALSYADGLARADAHRGVTGRSTVAIVGDGALTGGMAWEAVNNTTGDPERPLVIVLNDNGRSYAPTVGGMGTHLEKLRAGTSDHSVFEQLGLAYIGPVDGHDIHALQEALRRAKVSNGPVVVHAVTEKGRGFEHTERNTLDLGHAIKPMDRSTGRPLSSSSGPSFTSVFSAHMERIARERPDVVAVTAAMVEPTGLVPLQEHVPDRVVDVGIAEQHAVCMSAGMAMGGLHPVVAVYSTFANRALDQLLMDVALHRRAVTFVLDRSGVTGDDGPSHNGMWDLSALQMVPGLRIAAPRDGTRLGELLEEAVSWDEGPTLLRYPKGPTGPDVPAQATFEGMDVLTRSGPLDVLIVSVGTMAGVAMDVADGLRAQGLGTTVVDPRWVSPVNDGVAHMARRHRLVVTIEDNSRVCGIGSSVAQSLRDADVFTPVRDFGLPRRFLDHGKRGEILTDCGLDGREITLAVIETLPGLPHQDGPRVHDSVDVEFERITLRTQDEQETR